METLEPIVTTAYDLLIPVFDLFRNRGVPIVISLTFLAVLLGVSVYFWFWATGRSLRQIKKVTASLRSIEGHTAFAEALTDVREQMGSHRALQHAWQEFEETLIRPEPEERQIIWNTTRPSEYFNHEIAGLNFPILQALPNYFVGLGLLFTFLGIVAALYFASEGVSGSLEDAQRALGGLLSAATFKFMTSIAGLFCSIAFSLLYRWRIRMIDRAFEELCSQLERLMNFATPEDLAARQLRQLEQQTTEIKRFNSNIAMEIADAMASKLDASIAEGLRQAMEPLTQAVERLSTGMSEDNRGALRDMLETFQEQLNRGTGREMAKIAEVLGQMQGVLTKATESFGTQSEVFGQRIADAAERLDSAVETASTGLGRGADAAAARMESQVGQSVSALGGTLDRAGGEFSQKLDAVVHEMSRTLGPLGERLAGFQATLEELDHRLRGQAEAFAEVANLTRANVDGLDRAATRFVAAGEPLAETARALHATSTEAHNAIGSLQTAQAQIGDLCGQITHTAETLERSWGAYERRFEQVDQSLEQVFEKFAEGTQGQFAIVRDFTGELNTALDSATRTLASSVEQLQGTLDDISDSTDKLRDTLSPST